MNPGQICLLKGPLMHSALLIGVMVFGGCRSPEADYETPDLSTQHGAGYSLEIREHFPQEGNTWLGWNFLKDPVLGTLLDELIRSNLTLAEARERIMEARAQRGVITGQRQPQVNLEAEAYRAGTGEDGLAFMGPPPGQEMDVYSLGGFASWELDFWGRTEKLVEASDRQSEAFQEALRHGTVSLAAELCLAFIEARTLEQQEVLLDENIQLIEQARNLALTQFEAGNGTEIDVLKGNRQLAGMRALKPVLRQARNHACNRIAVLTGKPPSEFSLPPGKFPQAPEIGGLGLPADLLVRRADIRQAERIYAANVARSRSAEAELYPRLSLAGSLKLQTNDVGNLLTGDALVYSLGPSLTYPLFSGGRIMSQIDVSQSQDEQARLRLQQALLVAVAEVENAAYSIIQNTERMQHLENATREAQHAVNISRQLYKSGLGNRMQVVESERELLSRQEESLKAKRDQLNSFVRLFRALGGGWDTPLSGPELSVRNKEDFEQ